MIADVKRDIDREIKASEMGELKEGLDSAKKEVEKAADNIKKASGADEIQSSLKETLDDSGAELDEIDQVAQQMEKEISGSDAGGADSSAATPADAPADTAKSADAGKEGDAVAGEPSANKTATS